MLLMCYVSALYVNVGRTSQHDAAKDGVVTFQCAAVPAMVLELVLTLVNPFLSSLAN